MMLFLCDRGNIHCRVQFKDLLVFLQVIIEGQITVCSRYSQHLELQITKYSDFEVQKKRVKPDCHIVGQKTILPSLVINGANVKHLRIRFMGLSSPWSTDIAFEPQNTLVQVFSFIFILQTSNRCSLVDHLFCYLQLHAKTSNKFMNIWVTVYKEDTEHVPQYLV